MKQKIIIVLIAMLSFLLSSFQENKAILIWQENKPLTWDDFNGRPEKRFAAASTHYDIFKTIEKDAKGAIVKIEAVFFRNKSWKKKSWINDQVLEHEQKHFDIVELFARKLRKVIKETKAKDLNDLETKVDVLYAKNDKLMDEYQDLYDEETDGSMNGDQQRAWQKKIIKEIKEMDAYKETAVKVSF